MDKKIQEGEIYFPVGIEHDGIIIAEFDTTRGTFSLCTTVHGPFVFNLENENVRDMVDGCMGKEDLVNMAENMGFDRTESYPEEGSEEGEYFDPNEVTDAMYEAAVDYIVNYYEHDEYEAFEFMHDCSCAHGAQVHIDGNEYDFESVCAGQHDPRNDDGFHPYDTQMVGFIYKLWDKYHLKKFDSMTDAEIADIQNGIDSLKRAGFDFGNKYKHFSADNEHLVALTKDWLSIYG